MRLVPASGLMRLGLSFDAVSILVRSGLLPYNDKFGSLWSGDYSIYLAYGGRGGGKSESICDKLISDCLSERYFSCYYGRKVFNDVRMTCFSTLVYCIKKRGLEGRFSYSEADNSSMVIRCDNGNRFIPFGGDNSDRLKSIKDPTHIWCEEFDQFEEGDFNSLYPTLRTKRGRNLFFGSFNTSDVYTDNWIIRYFFPELYSGDKVVDLDLFKDKVIERCFVNFVDNYFIDRDDYSRTLMIACGGNKTLYESVANGAWGVKINDNKWLYNWDSERNMVDDLPILRGFPIYLSFDFNNDPFACTAWQFNELRGNDDISFIHCLREFSGRKKVEDMCMEIRSCYPNSVLYVTGDRSGQNEDLGRNQTLYQMIAGYLGISSKSLKLNRTNLEHADSRIFCNVMLSNYPNFYISKRGCPNLLHQIEIATVDTNSTKPQHLLKDRGIYKLDEFDSFRYFLQTYFHEFAKNKYLRIISKIRKF